MHFLIDAQLPPLLARWLGERGYTAEHVFELRLARATDRTIWNRAVAMGAVIITKDEDFALRRALASEGPAVVWIRRGNTTRRDLLRWFEPLLPAVIDALQRGETLIEIV